MRDSGRRLRVGRGRRHSSLFGPVACNAFTSLVPRLGRLLRDRAGPSAVGGLRGAAAVVTVMLATAATGAAVVDLPGPGLGNLTYDQSEAFKAVSWVDRDSGVPAAYPQRAAFGTNVGAMVNGHFVTVFAPDSGMSPGGLLVYDVSNPRQIRLVSRVYEPRGSTRGVREAHSIGMARIGGSTYLATQDVQGVAFWDVSDFANISQASLLRLPGISGDYDGAWQLSWQAPYVYVAVGGLGLYIVDASDPTAPFVATGGAAGPVPPGSLGAFRVGPVFALGNHLVLSSMESVDGWSSVDIADPIRPVLLDRSPDLVHKYYSTCFDGRRVYSSPRSGSMAVYDLADPAAFAFVDDRLSLSGSEYCARQDGFLFQGGSSIFRKIDMQGAQYRVVGSGGVRPGGQSGQVSPMGNLVFVGDDHGRGSPFIVHDTNPDLLPPKVIAVSPRDGAVGQALTSRVGVAFSDWVLLESVTTSSMRLLDDDDTVLDGMYSVQSGIANFAPSAPLQPATTYAVEVVVGGVSDYAGNRVATAFRSTFTTAAAPADPRLAGVTPDTLEAAGLVGREAEFSAVAVAGATYAWEFGDGEEQAPSSLPTATHTYRAPGHYTVLLTVTVAGTAHRYSFVHTVTYPVVSSVPTASSPITGHGDLVFNVNPDNGTVTAIDRRGLAKVWERRVGRKPRSLAVDAAGRVWVAVEGDDRLVALDAGGAVIRRIELGHGRGPVGIAFVPGSNIGLATVPGTGQVVRFDAGTGTVLARRSVNGDPRGIAVAGDGHAYVTRLRSTTAGLVTKLNSTTLEKVADIALQVDADTVDAEDRARGRPNYLTQIAISPDGRTAWVPSKQDNVLRGTRRDGQALVHDATLRAIVSQIDLDGGREDFDGRIDLNDREGAHAVALSPRGDYAFVALRGSNEVAVLDAYSGVQRGAMVGGGTGPLGIWLDTRGRTAFVYNFTSRSVAAFDISKVLDSAAFVPPLLAEISTVAYEDLEEEELRGLQIFYDASDARMAGDGYLSCASCHLEGGEDGTVWDFSDRGEGLRNTITLRGREGTGHGRLHWSANFDEIQDFENDIRNAFGGTGFLSDADFARTATLLGDPKAGLSPELDALARYVSSLDDFGRSPHREASGVLTPTARDGRRLFAELGCRGCHGGVDFTDRRRHQVGTAGTGSGSSIADAGVDTPTLLGVWRTRPYFHDGSAASVEAVVATGHGADREMTDGEQAALVAFLKSLERRVEEVAQVAQVPHRPRFSDKCWQAAGPDVPLYRAYGTECDGRTSQLWRVDDEGLFRSVAHEGFCVTATGAGQPLRLARCSDSPWQRWTVDGHTLRPAANLALSARAHGREIRVEHHVGDQQMYVTYETVRPRQAADTALSALSVAGVSVPLADDVFDYAARVPGGLTSAVVQVTPRHDSANVTVMDAEGSVVDAASGVPLASATRIDLVVVGGDGQTVDRYTVTVTRLLPPGPVRELRAGTGDGQIALFWLPPAVDETRDPATAYEYRVGDAVWQPAPGGGTAGKVVVAGLTNGEAQRFRVRAVFAGLPGSEATVAATPTATAAALEALELSGVDLGELSPETTEYAASVAHALVATTVTATASHDGAEVTVAPADADTDMAGHQVVLAVGENEIWVTVLAGDGETTRKYRIVVTRAASPVAPPVATLTAAGAVAEGAPAVFEATLDRAPAAALTVAVSVSGSAGVVAGTPPTSVTFAAGEMSVTLSVATDDDLVVEADGTVTATLSVGEGYTLGATTSADVTVTDDDTPSWTVTASPSLIEEGGASTLTVSTGNGTTFAADVAMTLGVSGTVSEADYALSASSLTLSARSESATVTLSASADDETEDAETATVTASVDGTAAGSTTVTVEDAAPAPTIAGVPQVGGVLEAVPSGAVGYQWLRAGEPIAGAVAARYAPLDADVDAVLSVRVNARGRWRTSASTMPIWTAPVSPPLAAGEEELLGTTMTLGLGASRYKLAGFLRRGDWERWPEDFGSVDDAAFADGRRELRAFLVNRPGRFALVTAPDIGDRTDVTAYWNEHALGPLEKRAAGGVTTWEAPELPNGGRYFGTVPEASEGVRVAVSLRRPLPEATLTASSETVAEGASATFAVDLDRAAWSALGVSVTVTETGTMLSGSVPATVTFAAGESTVTLTLATDDDAVVEGDGSLTVALVPGDGYVLGTAATAVTAVTDDDAAEFSVSASPAAIDEGAGSTLTVSIANGVTFAETQAIDLAVSGTAVPDDYRLSATSLVLGAGTSSVSATLTALRDVWAEPAETVTVTATRAGAAVGSATVTIAANEAVVSTVTVTPVTTPVTEGAAAQFELRLDAAALAALTVALSASETGSVLSGTLPSTVAFAVGESSRVLSLATVDDTVVEADSAVTLTLGTGSGYTPDTAASAVVTVEDNDIATFDVSASSEEIDEGEETTLTVSIGNGVTFAEDQTITLSVSGTAALADYLLSATSLALGAGASSVAATLTVVDDTDEEPAETLTVTATRDGSTVGSVTVTIRVSDVPSDDASLAALTLSGVDIGLFAADVTDYTAAVETEVASTTVSATVNDAGAAVAVADGTGSTAGDTRTVSLAEGDNAITVTVTAEDGTTTRTYRVTVTRAFARTWGERLADRDIALGPGAFPSGLWSDGSTLWVIENWSRGQVRAYALADGSRLSERDIRLRGGSGFPSGLWSDGSTLWVADHNGGVTAYLLSDGSRRPAEDLDGTVLESAGNLSPTGLWSDGTTLWVADHAAAKVFAYRLSDKTRLVGREFALVDGNGTPMAPFGVWSDGELLLASNYLLGGVLGYGLADGGLRASRSLATSASGTSNPMGLWSDGRVLWVVDDLARRVYAYAVPGLGRTRSSGVFPIRPSNRAFGVPAAAAGAAVWIPDGGLRSRIAAALGKRASAPIGERELAALEWLEARGAAVADLTGLQYAVNLTAVDLGANAIADLRVLAELPSLRVLNLDGTTADVWPLARLTGLRRLSLRGGGLTDVQALGGMTALRVLDIGDNHLEDLAPLGGLSNLEALRADGTAVEDTSALDALERLRILDLGGG